MIKFLLLLSLCAQPMSYLDQYEPKIRDVGLATYYGEYHHGKTMANGEPFDMNAHTLASRTIPFGTWVKVTIVDVRGAKYDDDEFKGKHIWCQATDRGPYGAYTDKHGRVHRMHYSRKTSRWRVKEFGEKKWHYYEKKPGRYRGLVDLSYGCMKDLTGLDKPPNLIVSIAY